MNSFLQRIFFGNTVQDYLLTLATILVVIALNRILSRALAFLMTRFFTTRWQAADQQAFSRLVIHPLGVFLAITVSLIALYRLIFPPQWKVNIYNYSLHHIFLTLGTLIQISAFIWLVLRVIDFIAVILEKKANRTADQSDNQLIAFFKDFLKVVIGIVGVLMILHFAFRYNVGSLLTGLSIVGAAIALALRESLENLIASFVIFFDRPFTLGDTVKVQHVTGTIEKIGLRSTRIRSDQKTFVTVPNKQMVDTILDNHTLRSMQRNELLLHISLDTPSEKIETIMSELRTFLEGIKEIDHFKVLFMDIQLQAYAIQTEVFISGAFLPQFDSVRHRLNLFALKALERHQVRIAGMNKEVVVR